MIIRLVLLLPLFAVPLFAQTAENVLLVLNEASPTSMEVGMYYAQKRGIPQSNILRIKITVDDSISRQDFERQIELPVRLWLSRNFAQDRILYIVLTKGIPLRITGTPGKDGTAASVDSELTLLYRKMAGQAIPPAGQVNNPYFLGNAPPAQARQFSHADCDIYLVSRLDGYDNTDIRGLIDRGFAPAKEGSIVLDGKGSSDEKGDIWLEEAADLLAKAGFSDRTIFDNTKKVITGTKKVLGYYSWGSNDPEIRIRRFDFEFMPGALAGMFVSTDGRTFKESLAAQAPADSGNSQSLAADLIREGATGISAHVSEPYLEGTVRPNILFPAYLSGLNLIESYYLAMPYLSWQTIVVGDPLCAPFRTRSLTAQEIDKGIDPDTEFPAYFGTRRLRAISVTAYRKAGIHPDTIRLMLRSEARLAKQDQAGARQSLEEAIARDDRLPDAHFVLASLYEVAQEYDKAIGRYRRLQQLLPDNPAVLNNLAYALAVRKNNIEEALPLAEKAYGLAKGNPTVSDTLGWIYYLAGQNEKAAKLLEDAVRSAPGNPEMHLHFAVLSEAMGNKLASEVALQRALEIDPKLESRPEVKQLKEKLKK
ncbi:MAG: TIGR03790 family protein [Acidobacteria bacterium]|nr:TIGR03790 family protein [Acidobacteriota bacterium]